MKQILCAFIGTSLSLIIAGFIAHQWVEFKTRQIEAAVRGAISDVTNAPANAINGLFDSFSF